MRTFAILNGPNLNRLGQREPEIYGTATLADLEKLIRAEAARLRVKVVFFQSNHEGALIDEIQRLTDRKVAGFIVNFGAYSHTSIALRDALSGSSLPAIEVHISDIRKREKFRHHSMTAGACIALISGHGFPGYLDALQQLAARPAGKKSGARG
ncbi:MAG TPA: type II 3-dehydroquinate dehydratase [Candidatus Didemnitutus sp.]|nr:type II 3-dehydroquinate dehydratase [Candidatus Didemnitutus sp.]